MCYRIAHVVYVEAALQEHEGDSVDYPPKHVWQYHFLYTTFELHQYDKIKTRFLSFKGADHALGHVKLSKSDGT